MDTEQAASTSSTPERNPSGRLSKEQQRERYQRLADALKEGKQIVEAMEDAGWPRAQARKGWAKIPKKARAFLLDGEAKHEVIGDVLMQHPERLEKRVVGKMYHEMMHGEGANVINGAKVLTQHRSIAAQFVQEQHNNVVVIQAPSEWKPNVIKPAKQVDALPPVSEQELPEYE